MPNKLATVILAAGQGTRMKSERAKVLHELGGEPMVAYPIRMAMAAGANPIVLVVGHQGATVESTVGASFGDRVRFQTQVQQKGTGHAVMEGMKGLAGYNGRVLILYGDVPLLRKESVTKLVKLLDKKKLKIALVTTELGRPTGYGRILRDPQGRVIHIVEEKDATPDQRKVREVNAGIYCVESDFLRSALARLKNDNAQGEYYLTDVVALAIADGLEVGAILVEDAEEVRGANTRGELAELDAALRHRTLQGLMASGVSVVDPANTYVGTRVKVGTDTILHPGVHLRGETTIGSGCVIDVGCVITNAKIASGVTMKPYTVVEEATVKSGAIIGPFSRLRPGAEIMEDAHVGNFVELKKARLGKGAKANHLAYLGDAKIGAGANVGAGTITCNYDGYGKYVTEIGDGVFVGSNATLVAPVKIGAGAYVAAGSTITDSIGKDDLAFGRARQEVKKGRAIPLRAKAKKNAGK